MRNIGGVDDDGIMIIDTDLPLFYHSSNVWNVYRDIGRNCLVYNVCDKRVKEQTSI